MTRHIRLRPFTCAVTLAATFTFAAPVLADGHSATAHSAEREPMSALDLVAMPRVGAPVVSPDGQTMLYPVTVTDRETLKRSNKWFIQPLDGSAAEAIDFGEDASSIRFAPDGRSVYFLSGREGGTHLWRHNLESGTLQNLSGAVSDFDIDGYALNPQADAVALLARVPRECETLKCELPADESKGSGRLYEGDGGFIRHWDSWLEPGTYNRLFAYRIAGDRLATGKAVDGEKLTGNAPTMPFGGFEEIAWSAGGRTLFFTLREAGADEPLSTDSDIYAVEYAPTPQTEAEPLRPVNLTDANEAVDTQPTPSPDGKYLAYLAMARPGYEADRLVIHLRDIETGETRALTQDFDRSFGSLAWTPDSRFIIATANDVLDTPAYRIEPESGGVERLDLMAGNEAHIGNVTPLSDNRLLFTRDSIGGPREIFLSRDYAQAEPLTDYGNAILGQRAAIVTERFSFEGANGETVWGQITKLEGATGKLPAILYVHGGPQGSFNDGWSSRWNPRVVASQGYAVVSVDFHGSVGYGQDFTDSINKDWGGKPLEDLQKGLAAALRIDPQIDGTKACAMGASYGGYMMNWIAGRWPDRFDCLVQHDGLFDMRSFYYTTEELWFPRWDFGGSYAEARDEYERWNPVHHVDKWKTPMLVITGEKDFRVPYTQGIASFTALQERGIPSQLLVFPDENHWVLGAANSLQWHETVFAWLDRWLKSGSENE